jgi:hypothetical protein
VFISSVFDVIDIGVKLLPVSLTPVIKPVLDFHPFHDTDNDTSNDLLPVTKKTAIIYQLHRHQLAYTSK